MNNLYPLVRVPPSIAKQFAGSNFTSVFDGAGAVLTNLTQMAQGVGDNQRIGDRVILDEIMVSVLFYNNIGATAPAFCTHRCIVFQYLADNGAQAPAIGQLLLSSSANAGTAFGALSMRNRDFLHQYLVLHDFKVVTTGTASAASAGSAGGPALARQRDFNVSLADADRFIGFYNAGLTGPNHIYMLFTTDQATLASNPQIGYSYALHYRDYR